MKPLKHSLLRPRFGRMRAAWGLAIWLMAFAPTALYGEAMPSGVAIAVPSVPINILPFAKREPLLGHPSYLQTVKYIDDGMRYIDPRSQFFISPAGEMCFRTRPDYPKVMYESFYTTWCIHPQFVDRVEAITNATFDEVRLWCTHAYPQCVHSVGEFGRNANSIIAPTIDYRQERAALENLIYLMGGNARPYGDAEPSPPR